LEYIRFPKNLTEIFSSAIYFCPLLNNIEIENVKTLNKEVLKKFDVIGNNSDSQGTIASENEADHNLKIKLITQDLAVYKNRS
jgi:hypothetical protein